MQICAKLALVSCSFALPTQAPLLVELRETKPGHAVLKASQCSYIKEHTPEKRNSAPQTYVLNIIQGTAALKRASHPCTEVLERALPTLSLLQVCLHSAPTSHHLVTRRTLYPAKAFGSSTPALRICLAMSQSDWKHKLV